MTGDGAAHPRSPDSTPTTSTASRSTARVGAGLVVFGLSGFVFLGLSGRDLGPADQAPLAVAWTILNAVGIGLFLPLEQEASRRVAQAVARRHGRPSLRGVLRYALVSLGVLAVVSIGLGGPISEVFLGGRRALLALLVLALAAQALEYLARGVLSGSGHFGRYSAQLAVDGGLRVVLSAVVFALPQASPELYTGVLVVSPLIATAVTFPPRLLSGRVDASTAALTDHAMTALVLTSLTSQLLANAGPLAIAVLSSAAEQDQTGRFVAAITVGRIPLFFFAAVQAVFLPTLAALVSRGRSTQFRRLTTRATAATVLLGVTGTAGVAVLGRWLMRLIYGPEFEISTLDITLIALSGGIFMVAQVLAQSLLAHRADRAVALGWSVGIVGTILALALPLPTTTTVALALCVGAAVAATALALSLRRTLRDWQRSLTPERP